MPRGYQAVDRFHPNGSEGLSIPTLTPLQQHAAFWDRDNDGRIYPLDTYRGGCLVWGRVRHMQPAAPALRCLLPQPVFLCTRAAQQRGTRARLLPALALPGLSAWPSWAPSGLFTLAA